MATTIAIQNNSVVMLGGKALTGCCCSEPCTNCLTCVPAAGRGYGSSGLAFEIIADPTIAFLYPSFDCLYWDPVLGWNSNFCAGNCSKANYVPNVACGELTNFGLSSNPPECSWGLSISVLNLAFGIFCVDGQLIGMMSGNVAQLAGVAGNYTGVNIISPCQSCNITSDPNGCPLTGTYILKDTQPTDPNYPNCYCDIVNVTCDPLADTTLELFYV